MVITSYRYSPELAILLSPSGEKPGATGGGGFRYSDFLLLALLVLSSALGGGVGEGEGEGFLEEEGLEEALSFRLSTSHGFFLSLSFFFPSAVALMFLRSVDCATASLKA